MPFSGSERRRSRGSSGTIVGHSLSSADDLARRISRISGKGYRAYEDLRGGYEFGNFQLFLEHIQGDPFASPSRARVLTPASVANFDPALWANGARLLGLEDFLARGFARAIGLEVRQRRGMGSSGLIAIDAGGQEILKRTAVSVVDGQVEARFALGLPAFGRRIDGEGAKMMLLRHVPAVVRRGLLSEALDRQALAKHVESVEDQEALRSALRSRGLVAFVADGSLLPRASGVDPRALMDPEAVRFKSPAELAVTLPVPNAGKITGMGLPEGITLIVGGGFHGKSTLLSALSMGIYNHIPGDGRERVVSDPATVKVRAEDGRRIEKVNISPFIDGLPLGKQTRAFSTDNASGSTSQAANIIEALELGARVLLIDEDTSATNFMIRDARMQALIPKQCEPITPFLDRIVELKEDCGVSTVLVMGGSGDYLEVADNVIAMMEYAPRVMTAAARQVVETLPTAREREGRVRPLKEAPTGGREPRKSGFDARRGRREVKISAKGLHTILYGTTSIDLSGLEQLVDPSQTRAIGSLIYAFGERCGQSRGTLKQLLDSLFEELEKKGLATVCGKFMDLAMPRLFEVGAAINRMRTLKVGAGGGE